MRTPEPLRDSPFQFRRRRSLHSTMYGGNRSDPVRPVENVPNGPAQFTGNPQGYMSGFPEQYAPHPGFMQVPENAYQPYDGLQSMSTSDFGHTADEFRFTAMGLSGIKSFNIGVEYDDCLMTEGLFQQHMESLRQEFHPDFDSLDTNEAASRILAVHSHNEEFGMEQDFRENMIEIQMAVEQARAEPLAEPNPEPSDFGPAIPQDFFEQAEQTFEEFYEMQPAEFDDGDQMEADFDAQEDMFEQPMEEMGPMADSSSQTLEDIVEAEPIQYEDQMPEDMADMPVYGSFPMPQEMYDEQMPDEMMDPSMMPDMMNPYMMPGPWGPMPGPGPGGP